MGQLAICSSLCRGHPTKNVHDMLHVSQLGLCFNERFGRLDRSFNGSRQLVHVLWLDNSFEVIFEDFREVICCLGSASCQTGHGVVVLTLQFRAAEIFQDLLPVRRIVISTQIRLQLAA